MKYDNGRDPELSKPSKRLAVKTKIGRENGSAASTTKAIGREGDDAYQTAICYTLTFAASRHWSEPSRHARPRDKRIH